MKDTLSLFLFVVVIVMATAAGGEAVPSKYYGECVLEARWNATASLILYLQLFCFCPKVPHPYH